MAISSPYGGSDPYRHGSPLSRSFLPLALITLGVVFLLSNLVPERGRGGLIVLGLGAAFMIGRFTTGRYGYAVPAGILVAIGAFIIALAAPLTRGISNAGLFFVLLGLGFGLVYAIGLRPLSVWPLFPATVLLALGLVMLGVSSLGPLASFSWIAAYWPLALVLLGVWLLFREAVPAPIRRPLATLGGLALLGYGLLAAAASVAGDGALDRAGAPGFERPPFTDTVTLDSPIAAGQVLTVNNASGSTTVHGGSGSTAHVVARRHFSVGGQNPDVRLAPTSQGLTLDASSTGRHFPFGSSNTVDYDIELPSGAGVVVQSSSGAINVNDVNGDVRLTSTSGSIQGAQLQHVRQVQSTSGSISLDGVFTDAAQVSASSGSVKIKLEPGSAVQLQATTSSGRIEPQGGLLLSNGQTRRDTLTGAVGTPAQGATLVVQTSSGNVVIGQ